MLVYEHKVLAGKITHLRPSEMRQISSQLGHAIPLHAFFSAITSALSHIESVNRETIERVFLFGVEMRKILEESDYRTEWTTQIEPYTNWPNVWPVLKIAFLCGLEQSRFSDALKTIRDSFEAETIPGPTPTGLTRLDWPRAFRANRSIGEENRDTEISVERLPSVEFEF